MCAGAGSACLDMRVRECQQGLSRDQLTALFDCLFRCAHHAYSVIRM